LRFHAFNFGHYCLMVIVASMSLGGARTRGNC
jgi:hypothetical protein